jgi:hypothetical protein
MVDRVPKSDAEFAQSVEKTRALPDGRTSPNQIPVIEVVLALFAAVLTGGRRFAHVERLRSDSRRRASY